MTKEKSVLIDLHHLPSLEFFTCILKFDQVILEAEENFQKQTYRNRCYIRGANKIELLSVPIQKSENKIPIKEVKINYSQNWWKEHWKSIASAYGKAPYFQFFAEIFENVYRKKSTYLFDFNFELLTICLKLMEIDIKVSLSQNYTKDIEKSVFDARGQILPNKDYKNRNFYKPLPYYQVFGNIFVPNLSILDLLFCEGKNSKHILDKSIK